MFVFLMFKFYEMHAKKLNKKLPLSFIKSSIVNQVVKNRHSIFNVTKVSTLNNYS